MNKEADMTLALSS